MRVDRVRQLERRVRTHKIVHIPHDVDVRTLSDAELDAIIGNYSGDALAAALGYARIEDVPDDVLEEVIDGTYEAVRSAAN